MLADRTHPPKANDHVRALRAWLATNPDASPGDRRVAEAELANLLDALGRSGGAADTDEHPDPRVALTVTRALLEAAPSTAALVAEHVEQFGEVLPTVLLADLARWVIAAATRTAGNGSPDGGTDGDADGHTGRESDGGPAAVDRVIVVIGRVFARGDDTTRAVVVTGFLEALPLSTEPGYEIVTRLPRRLRRELDAMHQGRPPRWWQR